MNGTDALSVPVDPAHRIAAAAHAPRHVEFPAYPWRDRQQMFHRHGAVRQRLELEVMIVPCETVSGLPGPLAGFRQPLAEAAPTSRVRRPRFRNEVGADHQFHAQRVCDAPHAVEIVFQRVDGRMRCRHGQAVPVEFGPEARRIVIDAAEPLDLRIAGIRQQFQDSVPWRELAGAVELERPVHGMLSVCSGWKLTGGCRRCRTARR